MKKVSQRWDLVLGLYLVVMGLALLDSGIVGLIGVCKCSIRDSVVTVAMCACFGICRKTLSHLQRGSDRGLCRTDDIDLGFRHESYLRSR